MRHKTLAMIFLSLSMVLLCVVMIMGALRWGVEPADQADQPDRSDQPDVSDQPADTAGPDEPVSAGKTGIVWDGPAVSEQNAPMGPAYFADAAFLGNELTTGLWLYDNDGLLPSDTSHWFCADGLTILGASPYAAQMPANTFDKVYIGFGINEVNYQQQTLKAAFDTVIDQIRASQPDAIIYLMSVTPVSKYCDENLSYKRSAVLSFNEMLQDIAREQKVWYLDVYPVLCGEDGYLPSDVTPDGIQFSPAYYQKWFAYMRTHYVPDGTPAEPTEQPVSSKLPETEG